VELQKWAGQSYGRHIGDAQNEAYCIEDV
jgi:hypothetical protein